MRINTFLLGSVLVAALGGFLFGFDTIVLQGTLDSLKLAFPWLQDTVFGLQNFWLGFTVAAALIGTIAGSLAAGKPADILGPRATLMVIALIYCLSALGCLMPLGWGWLVFFRVLGGLGVGGASVVSPMYIAEISPARLRGRLVAVQQFNIVLGILIALVSNWLIHRAQLGGSDWRYMLGIMAVPAALFFVLLFFTPQSPRWLVAKGRDHEARDVFAKLGTDSGNADEEVMAIQASLASDRHSMAEPFFRPQYLKPIMLVVAIAAFNQLSGINAVLYYAQMIFGMTGMADDAKFVQSVVLGAVNLVFTMAAMAIIDHFGRRKLMIIGSLGYIASLASIAWAFFAYAGQFALAKEAIDKHLPVPSVGLGGTVVLLGTIVFIASHAVGQGAVIWVFISEIFPNRVRARGQALGSITHWFMAAVVTWIFPTVPAGHAFAFFAVMMVLQLFWVVWVMPETKGVPLEEIQKKLGIE